MLKKHLLILFSISFALISCNQNKEEPKEEIIELNCAHSKLNFDFNKGHTYSLDFHDFKQANYLADEHFTNIASYANGREELSRPISIKLELNDSTSQQIEKEYFVQLSLDENFSSYKQYQTDGIDFYMNNFLSNTTYYLRVIDNTEEPITSAVSKIITKPGIRNLEINGITNVRDIGGFTTSYGTIKQGMLFRGACLNKIYEETCQLQIRDKGIEKFKELGIKSEIDLRQVVNNEVGNPGEDGPLGKEFNYYQCPMDYSEDILFAEKNVPSVKKFFELLTVESNYPIYFHCAVGADRTGAMAFLLEGLMGADNKTFYTDYLFSNFGQLGEARTTDSITNYIRKLNIFAGKDSLKENIEYYLEHKLGLNVTQINNIKDYLLEK